MKYMKTYQLYVLLFCCNLFYSPVFAQGVNQDGPIKPMKNLGDKEIIFLSLLNGYSSEYDGYRNDIFHYKSLNENTTPDQNYTDNNVFDINQVFYNYDLLTLKADKADFNADGKKEYVVLA